MFAWQAQALALFDHAPMGRTGRRHKAHRQAAFSCAACAPDAVGVVGGGAGEVEVHHDRQLIDVDAPCGEIGGDQHVPALFLEFLQRLFARALAEAAVKRGGEDVTLVQLGGEVFGRVLAGDEHEHAFPAVVLDQLTQELSPALFVHFVDTLFDHRGVTGGDRHIHPVWLAQHPGRQGFNGRGKCCREEQGLALRGQQRQYAVQFVRKSEVQQAVGFVEHQVLHGVQLERVVVDQVQQAPRRCDHEVGTTAQAHHLWIDRHATKGYDDLGSLRQGLGQGAQHLADLRGQLACGHQHQRLQDPPARGGWVVQPALQQRQGKGRGLAGAGLGGGEQIGTTEHDGQRLGLDRRGRCETEIGGGLGEGGREAERGKGHGFHLWGQCTGDGLRCRP